MKAGDVSILRYDSETQEACSDGDLVDYASIQHYYKECLEHGLTLAEAIQQLEEQIGA